MRTRQVVGILMVCGTMLTAGAVRAEQQAMPPGCAKIVAVLDQGGGLSPDEVAQKTNTDVETVRSCTDAWRQSTKGGAHP